MIFLPPMPAAKPPTTTTAETDPPPETPKPPCDWSGCSNSAGWRLRLRAVKADFGHHRIQTRIVCHDHLGAATDAAEWAVMDCSFLDLVGATG